jgi:pyruvate,water dikinase
VNPHERWILRLDECGGELVSTVGGKCAGLGELIRAGVAVPAGFAVTTNAHRAFLAQGGLGERIPALLRRIDFDDVHSVEEGSAAIRALVESTELPEPVAAAIAASYEELGAGPVAVRSSAVAEDQAAASFAGQLETYLWIEGVDEVARHTRRAWSGLFTPAALTYRHRMRLEADVELMCVGVQQMVEPRAAGVMFTLNPLTGDPSKVVIEASWGLGESVVSGEVDPDRFLVDKVTGDILERTIATKRLEHRFDPESRRVRALAVPAERADQPCLSDTEVSELAAKGKHIERFHGSARDIEWALVDGSDTGEGAIRILQSRSETVWSRRSREPVFERKDSAVEYVLAELLGLAGAKPQPGRREGS